MLCCAIMLCQLWIIFLNQLRQTGSNLNRQIASGMILPLPAFARPLGPLVIKVTLITALCLSPMAAQSVLQTANVAAANSGLDSRLNTSIELPPYLQCVPYAREISGVQIYGDAHTWWEQAQSKYARGNTPRKGAIMAFRPFRNMRLGHVAAITKIVDSRTVLLSHSNWSPINGRRGQIERDVKAIDVSPNNDWSMVRVWYHPLSGLGKTAWPVHGFIYNERSDGRAPMMRTRMARAAPELAPVLAPVRPARTVSSPAFTTAFAALGTPHPVAQRQPTPQHFRAGPPVRPARAQQARAVPLPVRQHQAVRPVDPVAAALSRYE